MSVAVLEREVAARPAGSSGSMAARRAVSRWAWRMFRREWRQQLLVLALIVVAVAATIVGSAVATDTPPPATTGFGTAQDAMTVSNPGPSLGARIASLEHRFGRVDVIDNERLLVPGSVLTFDLRAQDPSGAYGGAMLSVVSGRFPRSASEVALTSGVASELGLRLGAVWHEGGAARRVVGIVENPESLLDPFALVVPGQVAAPTSVTVLFDGRGVTPRAIGPDVVTAQSVTHHNLLNPETVSLSVLTVGMVLIALVAIGGFTVLAQRRLRSLGMLSSLGATDRQVCTVVRVNGVVVGAVGAVSGTVLGLGIWLAYRPHLEQSAHHVIGTFDLPWLVVAFAIVLAIGATTFATSSPARAVGHVPVVAALSGRPAPPRPVHRSAVPGIVLLAIAFVLFGYAGGTHRGSGSQGMPELVLGLIMLVPGVILLAPFLLSAVARVAPHLPVAPRLALRDLARYRARSGSALAAISIGVMIAVIITILAQARYGDALDYAGPNLAPNQLVVASPLPNGPRGPNGPPQPSAAELRSMAHTADTIGTAVGGSHVVELDSVQVDVSHSGGGRLWSGPLYVATPQLLRAFGIAASQIDPRAELVTMRPGLSGLGGLSLTWCAGTLVPQKAFGSEPARHRGEGVFAATCSATRNVAHPVVQELSALPSGTSAPNTVVPEQTVARLGLRTNVSGWLIETPQALTATQLRAARQTASSAGLSVESKNDAPSSSEVIDWATVFGMALALCILAMSVGLLRSETAGDLRTLAATGAGNASRRMLTAATAVAMGLLGAALGTVCGYVGVIGYLRDNSQTGGIAALGNVPVTNLLLILLAMPALAAVAGWLLAGREPMAMAHQPIE